MLTNFCIHLYFMFVISITMLHVSCVKKVKCQNNYILGTFDLDKNDDISKIIDQIIRYRISNKMTQCQLNRKKDRISILSFV